MQFLDVMKEVSAQSVRAESRKLFVLGLAGDPEAVENARRIALGPAPTAALEAEAASFLVSGSPPYDPHVEKRLRYSDLLVSLPGGPEPTELRPADTIQLERPEELVKAVLAHRPDLMVPIARRLPGFRSLAADQVIRSISRVNTEFSVLSSVSSVVPILAPLFPVFAGADVFVLTKNQIMMIFRLAAIYNEDLNVKARLREVLPVLGGAVGWRTLARELSGALPGGLGLPLKAAIAYSGTYATGRAAQMLFDEGRHPTKTEMRRIYDESTRQARDFAERLKDRLPSRTRTVESEPAALPAETEAVPALTHSVPEGAAQEATILETEPRREATEDPER